MGLYTNKQYKRFQQNVMVDSTKKILIKHLYSLIDRDLQDKPMAIFLRSRKTKRKWKTNISKET